MRKNIDISQYAHSVYIFVTDIKMIGGIVFPQDILASNQYKKHSKKQNWCSNYSSKGPFRWRSSKKNMKWKVEMKNIFPLMFAEIF